MNYHIMIDDKFIDPFIKEVESISKNANRYFVRGVKVNSNHVKHPKAEWIENVNSDYFLKLLNSNFAST